MAHLSPIDISNEPVHKMAARLSAGLTLAGPDVDLFSIEIEREWRAELYLVEDLFSESDHFASERSLLFWKLRSLMFYFSEREEYERCAVIRDLIWSLEIEFCL